MNFIGSNVNCHCDTYFVVENSQISHFGRHKRKLEVQQFYKYFFFVKLGNFGIVPKLQVEHVVCDVLRTGFRGEYRSGGVI